MIEVAGSNPARITEKNMSALAKTFVDDDYDVHVEVLSVSTTGLCKVKLGDKVFARHKDRLSPLNEEAQEMLLGKTKK